MLINLHSHLEGRLRASTAVDLAGGTLVQWQRELALDRPGTLTTYLDKVAASYPFFDTVERIERLTCEAVEDAAADGQDYLELRFGPSTHAGPARSLDTVVQAVCAGAAEGTRRSGMPVGIVVAALRHLDEDENNAVARVAARFAGRGVVGFDLAGDERQFPSLGAFINCFGIARAAGLGLTCHAAEAAPGRAVREAVEMLGVTRIGHGAHLADDAELLRWAAGSGVVVEVCPTSNWWTGAIASLAQHPAHRFREAGITLVLGDDNPVQTGSALSGERGVLAGELGFDAEALAQLDAASVTSAFAEATVREELRRRSAERGPAGP